MPGKAFLVDVASVAEGVKVMDVLAGYDLFQLENRIKPDYSNAGGLQMFDPEDDTDSPDGSWVDWCDDETGEDNPVAFLESQESMVGSVTESAIEVIRAASIGDQNHIPCLRGGSEPTKRLRLAIVRLSDALRGDFNE